MQLMSFALPYDAPDMGDPDEDDDVDDEDEDSEDDDEDPDEDGEEEEGWRVVPGLRGGRRMNGLSDEQTSSA